MSRQKETYDPFRWFDSSPEVIRLVVMMYVRYPLSLRNVEDGIVRLTRKFAGCALAGFSENPAARARSKALLDLGCHRPHCMVLEAG